MPLLGLSGVVLAEQRPWMSGDGWSGLGWWKPAGAGWLQDHGETSGTSLAQRPPMGLMVWSGAQGPILLSSFGQDKCFQVDLFNLAAGVGRQLFDIELVVIFYNGVLGVGRAS